MGTFRILGSGSICLLFFSIAALAASTADPIRTAKQQATERSLTKEAFQKIEPVLRNLQPGQPIYTTQLKWPVYPIEQQKKVVGLLAVSDGWAGELSGGTLGAAFKLGFPYALKDGFIYGEHVYGYINESGIFIPRHSVLIKAKVISESEYAALNVKKNPEIGYTYLPIEKDVKIFFKELWIEHSKELKEPEAKYDGIHIRRGKKIPLSEGAFKPLYSKERYEDIADRLTQLSLGTDRFDTVKSLNGIIEANYGGSLFTFFIKGFLNYKGEYILSKATPDGIYRVWPFGYVENGQEIPKFIIIFKNGLITKLMPYSSREQIEAAFN